MVEAWSASASLFARGQGVRHCLSEGAGKFGAEIVGFAQDHLGGTHTESAGRLRSFKPGGLITTKSDTQSLPVSIASTPNTSRSLERPISCLF